MKKTLFMLSTASVLMFGLTACQVTQTEEGKLPDVDIDVEAGNLPKYDVDGPDLDISTKKGTVTVPDVDVDINKKEVEVPILDIDIKTPGDPDYEDKDPKDDG